MNDVAIRAFARLSPVSRRLVGFGLLFLAMGHVAYGTPPAAPEVDPGQIGSVATLLPGGVLLLTGRRARK